jgi:hypothetical protein
MRVRGVVVNNRKKQLELTVRSGKLLALEYNEDPGYLADVLVHKLTVEARRRAARSGSSRRELARHLGTSVPQLYRLLGPANTQNSLGQLVALLHLLGCDVDFVINPRHAA